MQVGGLFWNYFSCGMDAKAAYGFHSLREKRPWAASGRAVNQAWYGYFSLSSGWFCAAPPLRNKATLQVRLWTAPPVADCGCRARAGSGAQARVWAAAASAATGSVRCIMPRATLQAHAHRAVSGTYQKAIRELRQLRITTVAGWLVTRPTRLLQRHL